MRQRIVNGSITTVTENNHNLHTTENNMLFSANSTIDEIGSEGGVSYGEFEERENIIGKWTSDEAGNNEISTAEIYEVVYFHFELINTQNSNGTAYLHLKSTYEKQFSIGPGPGETRSIGQDLVIEANVEVNGGKGYIKLDLVTELEKEYYISSRDDLEDPKKKYHTTWRRLPHKGIYDLFWDLTINERMYNVRDKKLAMFIDDHCMNMMMGARRYTCKAGWLDIKHGFISDWSDRMSLDGLWIQLLNGNSGTEDYRVTYQQGEKWNIPIILKIFIVKSNLDIETLKRIAVGILEKVSLAYEGLQAALGHDSGYEPADLIGNLIGLNARFRLYPDINSISKSDEEKRRELVEIYNTMMIELLGRNTRESLEVYRTTPDTFTNIAYKVTDFTPRGFPNTYCSGEPQIPANYVTNPMPTGVLYNNILPR